MAEIPPGMMTRQRPVVGIFHDKERLFRRFRPDHWEDGGVAPEAFELPSMSVNRELLGPPEWTKIDEHDYFVTWGVASFRVDEIPRDESLLHQGVVVYHLRPEHGPLKYNYPHTEVSVFRENLQISIANRNVELLDPEFRLRWRERLSQLAHVIIQPTD